ncbi:hypothetical protein G7046_g558 [Stylonectria norvegica]|nr:hypothetical protein G7046_g558 [Stylonectria norvegica]
MAGQQIDVYVASGITLTVAFMAMALRFVARRMTKQPLWVDDYLCLAAFCLATAYNSILIYWAQHFFLGRVIDPSLDADQREAVNISARRLEFCAEYCYGSSLACTKLTILTFYWRLFKYSSIRKAIQIMFGLSVAWFLLRLFMVSFQCLPTKYFWDKSIDGHCSINESQFFFGTILTHCIMDIVIFILPIIEVGKLRLRLGQKVAIIGLFLIGFIVCLASIFTIITSIQYPTKTDEMPRDAAPNFIWGMVEMNIAVVSACVPLLRPVFLHILPKSFLESYGSSHPISRTNISRSRGTNAIKLTNITRNKDRDVFETRSNRVFADSEPGLSNYSDPGHRVDAVHTVISSHLRNSQNYSSDESLVDGIHVRDDVVVKVESSEHVYDMRK